MRHCSQPLLRFHELGPRDRDIDMQRRHAYTRQEVANIDSCRGESQAASFRVYRKALTF